MMMEMDGHHCKTQDINEREAEEFRTLLMGRGRRHVLCSERSSK